MIQICRQVWIMCCLNLGSVLNISKILFDFLHFAKKFWTKYLKLRKRESNSTKKLLLNLGDVNRVLWHRKSKTAYWRFVTWTSNTTKLLVTFLGKPQFVFFQRTSYVWVEFACPVVEWFLCWECKVRLICYCLCKGRLVWEPVDTWRFLLLFECLQQEFGKLVYVVVC